MRNQHTFRTGANFKHGWTKTPTYRAWGQIKVRCQNTRNHAYPDYGGRGILVCSRWQKFELFLADMGPRPSAAHSIDRINNDGNYEPTNCRWATRAEQNRNTRVAFRLINLDGERMSGMDVARYIAMPRSTFFRLWHKAVAA